MKWVYYKLFWIYYYIRNKQVKNTWKGIHWYRLFLTGASDTNGDVQYEDDLDVNGAQQMIFPLETRFLQADATQITETEYNTKLSAGESVYIACFVGCTYHCG